MKRLLIAIALTAGLSFAPAAPASAATRNYDCSKPGNATKAACKAPKAAAGKANAAAHVTKTTTTATRTATTTRRYDCTKAGNANKAACKTAAAQAGTKTTGAVKTTTTSTATTIDCTRFYNKVRAQCRTSTSSAPARTTVAPAPKPASTAPKSAAANENTNPAGATAQCKDGTYSHAKTHRGACSHHGGVAKWL